LRMGTTGFIAQAYGRDSQIEISLALFRALFIALILGCILITLQVPISLLAFKLMGAGEKVTSVAESYFQIRIWSAPATFINYCILGTLIGMQRMKLALLTQLFLNGCNILLDLYFVIGLGWSSDGVALSSVISDYLAASFGLWLLRKQLVIFFRKPTKSIKKVMLKSNLRGYFKVNANLFMRTLFLTSAFFFFTSQSAQFGTVVLAANAILINMLQMLAYGLDGFAHAAEALVGNAYGKGDRKAFSYAVKSSMLWAGIASLLMSSLYFMGGLSIIQLMTDIPDVIRVANIYLPWLILAPVVAVWSYQLDGIYIGVMKTEMMRNTVGISLLIYILLALLTMPLWGNHALWACLLLFLLMRGVSLFLYYPKLLESVRKAHK
ncbi:MAG: MATE family efflux transporter, partial [Gammaproteobacteria bacterium]|nr:MATE family efflux transporter [Gammaproteobacteria bacterium]